MMVLRRVDQLTRGTRIRLQLPGYGRSFVYDVRATSTRADGVTVVIFGDRASAASDRRIEFCSDDLVEVIL